MTPGEKYADLGGQLPDEDDRERGKRHIAAQRELLDRHHPPSPIDTPDEPQEAEQ